MTKKQQLILLNAADKLDVARAKMNNGGKHWIKGAMRKFVKKNHKPGSSGFIFQDEAGPDCEIGYCSIGALRSVKAGRVAEAALLAVIREHPAYANDESIIGFNDRDDTKWGDVSHAFRKAAARLRREAAKL